METTTATALIINGIGVVFMAGVYVATVKFHSKSIENLETRTEKHEGEIGVLYGNAGLSR